MNLIDRNKARNIIFSFRDKNIVVAGDSMLDQWIWGKVSRISPEAPVPVVDVDYLSYTPGGAANVVNNISSLGGKVSLVTVIGDDENGLKLSSELKGRGVETAGIILDPARPTTTKTRIIANSQQLCRTDIEKRTSVSGRILEKVSSILRETSSKADICILSDYNKGFFSLEVCLAAAEGTASSGILAAGPKPSNIRMFKGSDFLALNEKEAREAYSSVSPDASMDEAGSYLREVLDLKALLVTRGDKGMTLFEKDESPFSIPALASEVFDVSGAGDTVLAVASLALAAGASYREAVVIANFAAAVVVKKVGTATVSVSELIDIIDRHQLVGRL